MTAIVWLIFVYCCLDYLTRVHASWPDRWPRVALVVQGVVLVLWLLLLLRVWPL